MIIKDKKISFLGDSITEGVGTSCPEARYFEVMKRACGLAEARCYGISGTRIARQSKPSENPRFDLDFCSRAAEMDDDADIVVVFGGTNDYGHGDAPFGTDSDTTPDTFTGACRYLMNLLTEKYCGKPIVFMTPLHRTDDTKPRFDGHTLSDFAEAIKAIAREYAIPVLDLYSMSGIQPNIESVKEKYMPDGLHPNDFGNSIIAERLAGFLMAL